MKQVLNILITLCLGLVTFFSNCDAPRHNPLDPHNPDNRLFHLLGTIKSISIPYPVITGVEVFWANQSLSSVTDATGKFAIEMVDARDGWLYLSKEGFAADSHFISWQGTKEVNHEFFLNALPVLDSLVQFSSILHRYPSLQIEQIDLRLKISDSDNDIDSVWASSTYLQEKYHITFNPTSHWYERTFSLFDLNVENIESLVGYPFKITVRDLFSTIHTIGAGVLQRVIRQEILFETPSGNEITTPNPTLVWQAYDPGFDISYMVQIFTAEITPLLVWQQSGIDQSVTSLEVSTILPENEYFWVIWAIDVFGNRVRSKPASFTVQQE